MMRNIDYYMDLAKKKNNLPSDLALNRIMGFKSSVASQLRSGKMMLSEEKMIELCRLAEIEPSQGLLDLNYWRSTGPAKSIYKRLAEVAQTASLTCFALLISMAPALAMCKVLTIDIIYYVN